METYTVYIICNSQKVYYKGFTSDVLRRLEEYNSSIGKYTSQKGPWTLVFKHLALESGLSSSPLRSISS